MSVRARYQRFHQIEPNETFEGAVSCPEKYESIGRCKDVGYRIIEKRSSKNGLYVHDCGKDVKFYVPYGNGNNGRTTNIHVPQNLFVLGEWTGATIIDDVKMSKERRGSSMTLLCSNGGGSTLFVVHKTKGVLAIIRGGNLRVVDWIRG